MNNGFNQNPYMTNPYGMNYMASPYGSPQNRIQSLEQQKRDIDNQISMLQSQMQPSGLPPININNQITPTPQQNGQVQNQFDFNGRFIKNESELEQTFSNALPVMLVSAEENKFYIKNIDGTVSKYRFEEYEDEEEKTANDMQVEELKKRIDRQEMALNQILAFIQGNSNNANMTNTRSVNQRQNVSNSQMNDVPRETKDDTDTETKAKKQTPRTVSKTTK